MPAGGGGKLRWWNITKMSFADETFFFYLLPIIYNKLLTVNNILITQLEYFIELNYIIDTQILFIINLNNNFKSNIY